MTPNRVERERVSDGIVIIGGGLAAARGSEELSRGGRHRPDPPAVPPTPRYPYFRPPLSKRYMRGEIDADDTLVESPAFYEAARLPVELETTVALGTRP